MSRQPASWIAGVEKGTKAAISVDFSAYRKQIFNNLRSNFAVEIPREEFSNGYACSSRQRRFVSLAW